MTPLERVDALETLHSLVLAFQQACYDAERAHAPAGGLYRGRFQNLSNLADYIRDGRDEDWSGGARSQWVAMLRDSLDAHIHVSHVAEAGLRRLIGYLSGVYPVIITTYEFPAPKVDESANVRDEEEI